MERTQDEKIFACIAHAAAAFGPLGLILNIVLYIVNRQKSTFVGRHVKQALGLQVTWWLINGVFGVLMGAGVGSFFLSIAGIGRLPSPGAIGSVFLLILARGAVTIACLVLIVLAAIKGAKGEEHKYPLIGEFVDRITL